jgi:hypothetical protein
MQDWGYRIQHSHIHGSHAEQSRTLSGIMVSITCLSSGNEGAYIEIRTVAPRCCCDLLESASPFASLVSTLRVTSSFPVLCSQAVNFLL